RRQRDRRGPGDRRTRGARADGGLAALARSRCAARRHAVAAGLAVGNADGGLPGDDGRRVAGGSGAPGGRRAGRAAASDGAAVARGRLRAHRMREYSPKRRTALVLAGSGTSGAYHAGVLKALDESGVKLDLVVGSGAGAVAAAFA